VAVALRRELVFGNSKETHVEVERIKFERVGGFANMRLAADLDMHDLPEEQADTLKELLEDLDFAELPAKLKSDKAMPDEFTYTITVEAEKWQHTVVTGDLPANEKLRKLLELLNRLARKKMRNQ
jgi:hypothetical protein